MASGLLVRSSFLVGAVVLCFCLTEVAGIVGGRTADISEAPYVAALINYAGIGSNRHYYLVCGCTRINSLWYLTSFGCIQRPGSQFTDQIPMDMPRLSVAYGYSNTNVLTDHMIRRRVVKIVLNPDYPMVALLKLHKNVTYSNGDLYPPDGVNVSTDGSDPYWAQPVPGIVAVPPSPGDNVTVLGWGAIQSDALVQSKVLKLASGPLRNLSSCGPAFDADKHLCFGQPEPDLYDACRTDNGGPLVNDRGELVGVFLQPTGSYQKPCDGHGKYFRADLIRDWVYNVTADLSVTNAAITAQPAVALLAVVAMLVLFFW